MSPVMPSVESGSSPVLSAQEALRLVELADIGIKARSLEELAEWMLPPIAEMMGLPVALLYVADPRLSAAFFHAQGISPHSTSEVELLCAQQFEALASQSAPQPVAAPPMVLTLYPLRINDECSSLLGLGGADGAVSPRPEVLKRLSSLLANSIDNLVERAESDKQIAHLNAYMTVNTMLVQSELNLHDLLEVVLYCCMDAVSAEAASVLLLDDDMANFRFYHVEGPSKPGLKDATLPADEGIAGHVLRTQEPVIVSEAQADPRFYQKFDTDSGFQTRNMIAVPLVTGKEPIGVLEVLNKIDADSFTEDEQMLLLSIAEGIAFAIRNAKMFEYVANSYCKQRQGQTSCRGCERPLGAWTPCVQYQKTVVSGLWRISDMPDFGSG